MEDNRKNSRVSIRWRSAIVTEENGRQVTTQGRTHDISITGVSVVSERNMPLLLSVTVYLLVHPGDQKHPQLIVEAQGKIMNSVFSSQQGGFRLGIHFIKFAGDSKQLLLKHLPKELAPAALPVPAALPAADLAPAVDPAAGGAPVADGTPVADIAPVEPPPQ